MGACIPRAHPHLQEWLNATAPSKGPPCSGVPYFSGSLGNTEPQVYTTPGFLFNLQLYNFGEDIFGHSTCRMGGRRQVQKEPIQFCTKSQCPEDSLPSD